MSRREVPKTIAEGKERFRASQGKIGRWSFFLSFQFISCFEASATWFNCLEIVFPVIDYLPK